MAKSQKNGNREVKKPKKVKSAPVAVAGEGLLAKAGNGGTTSGKKRA